MEAAALWISFAATAAALASAVIAWFARGDAVKAQIEASTAQKEAARAEGRSATAAETIARIQTQLFDGPPWTITWFDKYTYLLTNNSTIDATNVIVTNEPNDFRIDFTDKDKPRTIGAKSALKFIVIRFYESGFEADVVVTWTRAGSSEPLTWRHPIPPEPNRETPTQS